MLRETGRLVYESTVVIRSGGRLEMTSKKIFGREIEYVNDTNRIYRLI
jgi:hypothetical protein